MCLIVFAAGEIPDYAVRKIPDMKHSLLKRGFTYVPGDEAYPEVRWACLSDAVINM